MASCIVCSLIVICLISSIVILLRYLYLRLSCTEEGVATVVHTNVIHESEYSGKQIVRVRLRFKDNDKDVEYEHSEFVTGHFFKPFGHRIDIRYNKNYKKIFMLNNKISNLKLAVVLAIMAIVIYSFNIGLMQYIK